MSAVFSPESTTRRSEVAKPSRWQVTLDGWLALLTRLKIRKAGPLRQRLRGIDIARAVAMLGMLIAHTVVPKDEMGSSGWSTPVPSDSASIPDSGSGLANSSGWSSSVDSSALSSAGSDMAWSGAPSGHGSAFAWDFLAPLHEVVSGRAQATFVILAGLMVGMMALRATTPSARWRLRRSLVVRGFILLLIGVLLEAGGAGIVQILSVYGGYFLLSPLLITLPRRTLLWVSAAFAFIGPQIITWLTIHHRNGLLGMPYGTSGDSAYESVGGGHGFWSDAVLFYGQTLWAQPRSVFFTGTYPIFPEIALFLFGMALGRTRLTAAAMPVRLAVGGLIGVVALPIVSAMVSSFPIQREYLESFTDTTGHSAKTLCLLFGMSVASAVLGFALMAAQRFPKLTAPLALLGTWSLTFYLFHAFVLTSGSEKWWSIEIGMAMPGGWAQLVTLGLWLAVPTVVIALAAVTGRRGPAEAVVHGISSRAGALSLRQP